MGSSGDGANTSGDDVIFCVGGVGCKGTASKPGVGGTVCEEDCAKALAVKERMAMEMRGFFMRTVFTELLWSRRLT